MKSGYELDLKEGRPPTSIFPEGFFIEDFTHYEVLDQNVLDENNGRFCITPEYPNGTYAYFLTINDKFSATSGVFENYREPVFPYVIGENYHSIPNEFNFNPSSNQDDYDLVENKWRRNTHPYNLLENGSQYPYLYVPSKLDQTATIVSTTPGSISKIGIVTGGLEYRIGEELVFNNEGTGGKNISAKVSKLKGRSVNNISCLLYTSPSPRD